MLVILRSRRFASAPEAASFLGLNPIEKQFDPGPRLSRPVTVDSAKLSIFQQSRPERTLQGPVRLIGGVSQMALGHSFAHKIAASARPSGIPSQMYVIKFLLGGLGVEPPQACSLVPPTRCFDIMLTQMNTPNPSAVCQMPYLFVSSFY